MIWTFFFEKSGNLVVRCGESNREERRSTHRQPFPVVVTETGMEHMSDPPNQLTRTCCEIIDFLALADGIHCYSNKYYVLQQHCTRTRANFGGM